MSFFSFFMFKFFVCFFYFFYVCKFHFVLSFFCKSFLLFLFCCAGVYVVGILNYHFISKVYLVNYLSFSSFFPFFFAISNVDETILNFFCSEGFANIIFEILKNKLHALSTFPTQAFSSFFFTFNTPSQITNMCLMTCGPLWV